MTDPNNGNPSVSAYQANVQTFFSHVTDGGSTGYLPTLLSQYSEPGYSIGNGTVAANDVPTYGAGTTDQGHRAYIDGQIQSIIAGEITNGGTAQPTANTLYFVFTPPSAAVWSPSVSKAAVTSSGSGYHVGDTLTVQGGTFTTAATLTVTATGTGGIITSVAVGDGGHYTVQPTNPVTVTGGTGSNAQFTLTFPDSISFYLGYHSSCADGASEVYYAVIPDETNGFNATLGGLTALQGEESVSAHEMAEAITDALPETGWVNPNAPGTGANGPEVGDQANGECYTVNNDVVQYLWSNATTSSGNYAGPAHTLGTGTQTNLFINQLTPPAVATTGSIPIATFTEQTLQNPTLSLSAYTRVSGGRTNWTITSVTGGTNGVYVVNATPPTLSGSYGAFDIVDSPGLVLEISDGTGNPATRRYQPFTVATVSSALTYNADYNGSLGHNFRLVESSDHTLFDLYDTSNLLVFTQPVAETGNINITADPGVDSSLTIDYSNGKFTNAVSFDGGTGTGTHTLTVENGGTFTNETYSYSSANAGTINLDNQTITFSDAGSIMDATTGNGTLNVSGTGTVVLTASNSYTQTTIGSSATLQVGNNNASGGLGTGPVTANGSLVFDRSDSITVSNNISGSGSLTEAGAGTITMTGSNTYTGRTTINAGGTLKLGISNAVPGNSDVTDNGTLNLNGKSDSIGALSGSGTMLNNGTVAVTLTLGATGHDGTFSGIVKNNGGTGSTLALTKTGGGTEILNGTNTYSGGTTVSGGMLQGNSTSLQRNITDNASLVFDQASNGTYTGVISGTGSVTKQGAGTLIVTGASTYSGGTAVSGGVLQGNSTSLQRNITDNASLVFDQAGNGTYAGAISGTGSITKQNTGTLTLTSTTSSYTGATTISAGTLQVGATNTIPDASDVTDNGTLDLNSKSDTIGALAGGGKVLNNGTAPGTLTVGATGHDGTFSGILKNNGGTGSTVALTKTGGGTQILTGANTYSGGTLVSGGILQGNTTSLQGNITDNSSLVFDEATDGSYNDAITGSGSVIKLNTGTLALTGPSNSYSGSTVISFGALLVGEVNAIPSSSDVIDNATLDLTGPTEAIGALIGSGTVTCINVNGAQTLKVGSNGHSGTFSGVIQDGNSILSLTKVGSGIEILTGANSYTGSTTVSSGVLQGNSTSLRGNITDSASVVFDQAGSGTYAGAISGTGSVTKQGAGTLALVGTSNSYTGATTISAGTLQVGALNALPSTSDLTVNGVLDMNGYSDTIGALNGSSSGTVTNGGTVAVTLTIGATGEDGAFSGVIGDGNNGNGKISLTKTGSGTETLSGANTYTGATTISSGGTVRVGAPNAFPSTSDVTDNGTLDLNGYSKIIGALSGGSSGRVTNNGSVAVTLTVGASGNPGAFSGIIQDGAWAVGLTKTGSGTQILTGPNTYSGSTTVSGGVLQGNSTGLQGAITNNASLVFDQAGNGSFGGAISGTGSVTKQGAGTLTLTGSSNTYSGTTTINAGILQLGVSNAIPSTTNVTDNVTLDLNGFNDTIGALNGNSNGRVINNGTVPGTLTLGATGDNGSFAGGIDNGNGTGTVGLVKIGSGTEIISGNFNGYTGGTTISAGVLEVDGSIVSAVTVASGGILEGTGTLYGNVYNSGTIIPGTSAAPGWLTVSGNYTQNADGALDIFVASANQYGTLEVDGIGSLNGTLNVSLMNNFSPTSGGWVIIFGGSLSSLNFSTENLPSGFQVRQDVNDVFLIAGS